MKLADFTEVDRSTMSAAPAATVAEDVVADILMVDDRPENLLSLEAILADSGRRLVKAQSGTEALKRILAQDFAVILLDVQMPGMDGYETARLIRQRERSRHIPIIFVTAHERSEASLTRAYGTGAVDFLFKPLVPQVLQSKVSVFVDLFRKGQEILRQAEQIRLAERRAMEQRLNEQRQRWEAQRLREEMAEEKRRAAELERAADRARRDLQAAARIQESFLPRTTPNVPEMRFAWRFKPCKSLAGDSLNICRLDDDHVGVYVLDVSGHGVAAALLAVSATRILAPASDPHSLLVRNSGGGCEGAPVPPAEVADRLNRKFAWDDAIEQFLTMFYAVVNVKTGDFRYVSAGHPGAIQLSAGAAPPLTLEGTGMPIGIGDSYEDFVGHLKPGDRLYLYSDGVTEAMGPSRKQFGKARMLDALGRGRTMTLDASVSLLLEEIDRWCGMPPPDDISVLALERAGGTSD
jgi:sigma-B regulation protein RsbU (phosphoserine phosphatase)